MGEYASTVSIVSKETPKVNFIDYVNKAYIPFFQSKKKFVILYGGRGSGKSYAVAQKLVLQMLLYKKKKFFVARKTLPSLKNTCIEFLLYWMDEFRIKYDYNKADMIITTSPAYGGHKILFRALDDVRKLKSLTDVDYVWVDEVDEISMQDFLDLSIVLRGRELPTGEYRQMIMTFNPGSYARWLKELFFDNPQGEFKTNTDIFHFTYKDNKFLSQEDKQYLEALKQVDEYFYTVYTLGQWGVLRNKVYNNYEVKEFPINVEDYEEIIAGVDFGYNSPSGFVLVGVNGNELYVIDEIYATRVLNSTLIALIKDKLNKYNLTDVPIYADTAEPDRIEEFKEAGLYIYPAKKNVVAGINTVKTYKIIIHPQCVNFKKEIEEYKYKEDREGNVLEEPVGVNDHLLDALRYCVYTHFQKSTPRMWVL